MNLLFKHNSTNVWKCSVFKLIKPWEINREEDLSSWREFKEILYKRCGFSWGISFIIHMMVHWEIKENGIDVVDLSIGSDLKLASVSWLN